MKTYQPKPEQIERKWHLIDARGKTLGRLASKVAQLLRGKHKPIFTPHIDTGDFVIIINAGDIDLTGSKEEDKIYHSHSGYPGGVKSKRAREIRETHPERLITNAVKGMLPKNRLGKKLLTKLKVYADEEHPHQSQKPEKLEI